MQVVRSSPTEVVVSYGGTSQVTFWCPIAKEPSLTSVLHRGEHGTRQGAVSKRQRTAGKVLAVKALLENRGNKR